MNSDIKKAIRGRLEAKHPIIVEVGSHYGEDTANFLKIFKTATIYCFEPDPRNIAIFREHIADNRAILFEHAVSNADGQVDFYQSYKSDIPERVFKKYSWIDRKKYVDLKLNASGASSLKQGHPLVEGADVIKVRSTRIDSWMVENSIERVDFIWIDVQGAEKEVIEGFGSMSRLINYVWVEYGELAYNGAMSRKQTVKMLSGIGFSVVEKLSSTSPKGNLLFQNQL